MVLTARQITTALAVLELDGIARRLVLCTPDLSHAHLQSAFDDAAIDIVLTDDVELARGLPATAPRVICSTRLRAHTDMAGHGVATEWVLFTSGTTGRPKLAVHDLSSLTGAFVDDCSSAPPMWSTFYDIRRYGGLQILLRALTCGGSMILSDSSEPVADFLRRAGVEGVTHISGTPSHWRRALMSDATRISPRTVRLSGEVSDQAILDSLRRCYPAAMVEHAFASTEAGLVFTVRDGRAGFPASLIGGPADGVELRLSNDTLHVRSARTATRYLGVGTPVLRDAGGFVDTGDLVELSDDRYRFVGRRGGIINVGGAKVHPEAVESVINQHAAVFVSRVSARSSPITGAIVVAEIVLRPSADCSVDFTTVRSEILDRCRRDLSPHQVPAMLRQVASLDVGPAGKLERLRA